MFFTSLTEHLFHCHFLQNSCKFHNGLRNLRPNLYLVPLFLLYNLCWSCAWVWVLGSLSWRDQSFHSIYNYFSDICKKKHLLYFHNYLVTSVKRWIVVHNLILLEMDLYSITCIIHISRIGEFLPGSTMITCESHTAQADYFFDFIHIYQSIFFL